jgi:hypothetical protein
VSEINPELGKIIVKARHGPAYKLVLIANSAIAV